MKYILDRFEGDFALIEQADKTMLQVSKKDLPAETKEGCVLKLQDGIWTVLHAETQERATQIRSKMDKLWQ